MILFGMVHKDNEEAHFIVIYNKVVCSLLIILSLSALSFETFSFILDSAQVFFENVFGFLSSSSSSTF